MFKWAATSVYILFGTDIWLSFWLEIGSGNTPYVFYSHEIRGRRNSILHFDTLLFLPLILVLHIYLSVKT